VSAVAGAAGPRLELDHLVVACRSLAAGRDWCESTFGVGPAPLPAFGQPTLAGDPRQMQLGARWSF